MAKSKVETADVVDSVDPVNVVPFGKRSGDIVVDVKGGLSQLVASDDGTFGVLSRPRRIGAKVQGAATDLRPQVRYDLLFSAPTTPEGEQLVRFYAAKYLSVDAAKLPLFNGKGEAELTDTELAALDETSVLTNTDTLAQTVFNAIAAKLAEEGDGGSGIESEFKAVAEELRGIKQQAIDAANAAGNAELAELRTAEKKVFTASYVRSVFNGNTSIDGYTEQRAAVITAKVNALRNARTELESI